MKQRIFYNKTAFGALTIDLSKLFDCSPHIMFLPKLHETWTHGQSREAKYGNKLKKKTNDEFSHYSHTFCMNVYKVQSLDHFYLNFFFVTFSP